VGGDDLVPDLPRYGVKPHPQNVELHSAVTSATSGSIWAGIPGVVCRAMDVQTIRALSCASPCRSR
jgi:hypothetical protein